MDEVLHRISDPIFEGWQPLLNFAPSSCPQGSGVYAVVYSGTLPIRFRQASSGGWHKGWNPSVSTAILQERWIPETRLAYIGKSTALKSRLRTLRDFGQGKAVPHWGGRLLWQLDETESLQIGWLPTHDIDPRVIEREMLDAFARIFNRLPFANLVR